MENLIEMDDLGVPLFLETPIWGDETTLQVFIRWTWTCGGRTVRRRLHSAKTQQKISHLEANGMM